MGINMGILGLGYWGSKVIKEYLELANEGQIESVSICDIQKDKLEIFSKDLPNIPTYIDIETLLRNVDAIHVCTNNQYHYEICLKAIESDKHVLVEKPMTLDHNQAYELIEKSNEHGVILQVGHIFRFSNAVKKIKELIEKGYFGTVYYYKLKWTSWMDSPHNVDIIWDLLPHPLDILNFITKKWPLEYYGISRPFRREKQSEVAFIIADYGNFFSSIEMSWLQITKMRTLEIVGSDKSAIVNCVSQQIDIFENSKEKEKEKEKITIDINNTIRDEILNFRDAINNGKNRFNSSIIGAKTVEHIERVMRMSNTGVSFTG